MNIGIILTILTFALTLISAYFYFNAGRSDAKSLRPARLFYKLAMNLLILTSAYFMYLILTHQFQYDYIYRYSSRSLPLGYLVSSFWAGQEGSFLLWTLLISVMGFFALKSAKQFESWTMFFILIAQAFFLFLMIDRSPFEILPTIPPDGAGLNPLLQDPWMVVHPPVLFVGYAAITIPFALAMASMINKSFSNFVDLALPWTLFSSATLGAGIIIGGFWAYEVLGWGGYWGWDPVENSSLVPWLTTLALFHGLVIQKAKNSLIKSNLFLSVVSFVLVIYATFLTRSGVLADFSVHSFQDNGQNLYLTSFMLVVLCIGTVSIFLSRNIIQQVKLDPFKLNRESGLFWSLIALCLSALFILIGTSSPIITGLFASSPSQVDISFYDKVNFPIGIIIVLLLGITPLLMWGHFPGVVLKNRLITSFVLTLISTIIAFIFGVRDIALLIFVLASAFAVWSNLLTMFVQLKLGWKNVAGPLSHFGVGLMFIGIIISGNFDESVQLKLIQNKPADAMGYKLTYINATESADGKTSINIDIEKNGKVHHKHPKHYFSTYNNAWMREPDITIYPLWDTYISVLERTQAESEAGDKLVLDKGSKDIFNDYEIEFTGFEFDQHGMTESVQIGAKLIVTYGGKTYNIKPVVNYVDNVRKSSTELLPTNDGSNKTVILSNLNADSKMIELTFGGFETGIIPGENIAVVEFSIEPFMNFVWLGTILLTLGTIIAIIKRFQGNGTKEKINFKVV